jgi:hypothetical protein
VADLVVKIAILVAILAALALAVAAGDRATFVPPPESVAENFVRQLMAGRYDRARPLLSRHAAVTADIAKLETLALELERSVGGSVTRIDAEPLEMKANIAEATVIVHGRSGAKTTITFALVREKGLWKIDGWTR